MKRFAFILLGALISISTGAAEKLNVVATLPDLGAVAHEIGRDHIQLTVLAQGTEDPHFVEAKPSFVRTLNKADVLIEGGAELEVGWLPSLLQASRNRKIQAEAPGHVIGSRGVPLIDVPQGPVDRSQGDVHLTGNPHYLLDPVNGKIVAENIAKTLAALDPAHSEDYKSNLQDFKERIDRKMEEWSRLLDSFRGTRVITYHKNYDYLLRRFGLELAGTIEPKPGIEPSPSYIQGLIQRTKDHQVQLVLVEPNRPMKTPRLLAEKLGAKLLALPLLVGGNQEASDYIRWLNYNVTQINTALRAGS